MSSRAPTYWEGRYGVKQSSAPRQEQGGERGGTGRGGIREGRGTGEDVELGGRGLCVTP